MHKKQSKQDLQKLAIQYMQSGELMQSMKVYYDLHELDPSDINALESLVTITSQLKATDRLIINLQKLIKLNPINHQYYDRLSAIYSASEDWDSACQVYQALILNRPKYAEAHYNLAFYLKKQNSFDEAILSYQRALDLGISQPEEVYLNMAVIYADNLRKEILAEEVLLKAITLNKSYIPALYNLANIYEDKGNKEKTIEIFQQILVIKPDHAKVLARLLQSKKISDENDANLTALNSCIENSEITIGDKIDAYYALGKAYTDCKQYNVSFRNYAHANNLNALEMPKYTEAKCESYFEDIINESKNRKILSASDESPVFICGLFRTGSTLIEQILSAHPKVLAGGERDFFARQVSSDELAFPQGLSNLSGSELNKLANEYSNETKKLYGTEQFVTDKRPDNFVYLDLIKRVFPKAKIIFTTRDSIDNCLSIYFTRLSSGFDYSVDLKSIAHYYKQHLKLLDHWKSLFQDDLFVLNYDDLISEPETHIKKTLEFLNLDWDDNCLNFYQLKNPVKTASVWQVRQPLYSSSSGRWKNYQDIDSVKWLINDFKNGEFYERK